MNDHTRCWICGTANTRHYRRRSCPATIDSESFRITDSRYGETHGLRKCSECSFVFAESLPDYDLIDCYRAMEDPEYAESAWTRQTQMRRILDRICIHHGSAESLLDIGAGLGAMVAEARAKGLTAEGVEPSRWLVDKALQAHGIQLRCGTLDDWEDDLGNFGIVTMIDVIEHTDDPMALFRQAARRLAPGGLLGVTAPMIDSVSARVAGRHWWHYRVGHVGYFGLRSMRRALESCGLQLIANSHVGWYFPASYLLKRLMRYFPFWPVSVLLESLSRRKRIQRWVVPLNLYDSRMFLAKNGPQL